MSYLRFCSSLISKTKVLCGGWIQKLVMDIPNLNQQLSAGFGEWSAESSWIWISILQLTSFRGNPSGVITFEQSTSKKAYHGAAPMLHTHGLFALSFTCRHTNTICYAVVWRWFFASTARKKRQTMVRYEKDNFNTYYFQYWKKKIMPRVRLELTAFRLWDWRAAYCATEAG